MRNALTKAIAAALFLACALPALAVTGQPPIPSNGPGLVDGTWLNGLAGGLNNAYQYGFTAAGTNQSTALQLPSGFNLMELDTVAASTGVALPPCLQGTSLSIYNNGASTVTVYPSIANNPITAGQDTINNATSVTIATHVVNYFACAKNGVWSSK
jgi:hypothetical protein